MLHKALCCHIYGTPSQAAYSSVNRQLLSLFVKALWSRLSFYVMQITKVKMMKVSLIERKLLLVLFFFKEKKRELTPMATTISNANRTVLRIGSGVNGRKEAGCGHVKNISGY